MKSYGQKLDQAYTYLKRKRPSIALNEADAKRTMEAEEGIYGGQASRFQLPIGKQTSSAAAGVPFGWPGGPQKPQQTDAANGGANALHFAPPGSGNFGYNGP